jgi:protein phosphatase
MVVKPADNLTTGKHGVVQPGLKVRGPDYLRLVYGPGYARDLDRLRDRNLGRKRGLAQREYALGLEGLERLARGEPLWRGPRVRLRRPRPGVRARRPPPLTAAGVS